MKSIIKFLFTITLVSVLVGCGSVPVSDVEQQKDNNLKIPTVVEQIDEFPVLTLVGAKSVKVFKGKPYVEFGFNAFDKEDGDLSASVLVSGEVDINTIGTYTKTYKVTDSAEHIRTKMRTIIVKLNKAPVLTLNDEGNMTVYIGKDYVEPGFKALDREDGDVTSNIIITVDKIK
jgi:hypothetical protein